METIEPDILALQVILFIIIILLIVSLNRREAKMKKDPQK